MDKLKLGDKVRFVNENLEGFITSIKEKNTYGVTIEDDFEIPVLGSNLVKVSFDLPKKEQDEEVSSQPKINTNPIGIFAAYQRNTENSLTLWLHNNFSFKAYFTCYTKDKSVFKIVTSGLLQRNENVEIEHYNLENFDQWQPLYFQFILVEPTIVTVPKPIMAELNFNAKVFHQSLKYCFFLSQQAYVFKLDDQLAQKPDLSKLLQKDFNEKLVQEKPNLSSKPEPVIDLHYEYLLTKGFAKTNDITGLQMEVFTKSLESAFTHKLKQIVFIHGVGNQYLKNKILTYLVKQKDIVLSYNEADILKYGGGATQVWLK